MMRVLGLLLAAMVSLCPGPATAHALDPGYLELASLGEDRWRVTWRIPNVQGQPMPIEAVLPPNCQHGPTPAPVFDGRAWTTGWITFCENGLAGEIIEIRGLELTKTDTLVRYELEPGRIQIQRLTSERTSFTVPAIPDSFEIFTSYTMLGVTHILEGFDHLLFVFALLLLIRDRARLFWAVTAFTLAHSITLGAATLGWLRIPSPPVEAVIALSIVFLAYELTFGPQDRGTVTRRFPWVISFTFGLIHGLGFAGALREIGLPETDIPMALFAFNIGVEAGQLLFIVCALALFAIALKIYPKIIRHETDITRVSGYVIGGWASYWVIERVGSF